MSAVTLRDLSVYGLRLLKAPISNVDNVILTPPSFKKCRVLNKNNGLIETFHIGAPIDHWTVSEVYVDQDYSCRKLRRHQELLDLLNRRQLCKQSSLVLDVGANIGASARYLSSQWPDAFVWCIEPSARNIALAQLNANSRMRVIKAALGEKDGSCFIANAEAKPNAFRVSAACREPSEACPMVSMKSLMQDMHDHGLLPFILKIDIEGQESEVFKDADSWLHKWPLLMIELHDWMLPGSGASANVLKAIAAGKRDVILKGNTLVSFANQVNF